MENYAIYLRKSRSDDPNATVEETVARHEKILLDVAKKMNLHIVEIYREVVSGETIADRPQMQRLLNAMNQDMYAGVLVMEVERLARGNSIDQGIISQSFQLSDTKIITPHKVIDTNNEFDAETLEFGLFMSRREYKTINRRLQAGRIQSVKEGKYVGNKPPYGYIRKKLEGKGFTLEPHPEQSKIVVQIFNWYVNGFLEENGCTKQLGVSLIVRRLNQLRIPPQKGDVWVNSSIQTILRNPIYIGKIKWNSRPTQKKIVNGTIKKIRPRKKQEEWIVYDGIHQAIIDADVFREANEKINKNRPNPCISGTDLKNPLAGVVRCGLCGRSMIRRPYTLVGQAETLLCPSTACKNVSSPLHIVEQKVIQLLNDWLCEYNVQYKDEPVATDNYDTLNSALKRIELELETLNKQYSNIHDLLEQKIYTTDTFLERSKSLSEKIQAAKSDYESIKNELHHEESKIIAKRKIIPTLQSIIDTYYSLDNITSKNRLLKEILDKVDYIKYYRGKKAEVDNFRLILHPRI